MIPFITVAPERLAGDGAAAQEQVERARRRAVSVALVELVAHQGALVRGLQHDGVAGDERAGGRPPASANGKLNGLITAQTP